MERDGSKGNLKTPNPNESLSQVFSLKYGSYKTKGVRNEIVLLYNFLLSVEISQTV